MRAGMFYPHLNPSKWILSRFLLCGSVSSHSYSYLLQLLYSTGVGQAAVLVVYDVITFPVVTFTFLRAPINKVSYYHIIWLHWEKLKDFKYISLNCLFGFEQMSNLFCFYEFQVFAIFLMIALWMIVASHTAINFTFYTGLKKVSDETK